MALVNSVSVGNNDTTVVRNQYSSINITSGSIGMNTGILSIPISIQADYSTVEIYGGGADGISHLFLSGGSDGVIIDCVSGPFKINTLGTTSTPSDSATATSGFGTSLTAGTAKQNTTGYNILVNISLNVSSATSATVVMGVASGATPTTNTVVPTFTTATFVPISFSALVPNNYYLLVNTTGTISISSITTQACFV